MSKVTLVFVGLFIGAALLSGNTALLSVLGLVCLGAVAKLGHSTWQRSFQERQSAVRQNAERRVQSRVLGVN